VRREKVDISGSRPATSALIPYLLSEDGSALSPRQNRLVERPVKKADILSPIPDWPHALKHHGLREVSGQLHPSSDLKLIRRFHLALVAYRGSVRCGAEMHIEFGTRNRAYLEVANHLEPP